MTNTPHTSLAGPLTPREIRSLAHTALASHPAQMAATAALLNGRSRVTATTARRPGGILSRLRAGKRGTVR